MNFVAMRSEPEGRDIMVIRYWVLMGIDYLGVQCREMRADE